MKSVCLALCLPALLAAPLMAAPLMAAPVHITGAHRTARTRLSGILVARAPLSGESRRLTRGDLALKLRQAGCNPDTQVVFDGAGQSQVTVETVTAANAPGIEMPGCSEKVAPRLQTPQSRSDFLYLSSPALPVPGSVPLIHRGDALTIYIQSGPLTITAPGIARDNGGAGDTIRVHREGVMTDLTVQVMDAQTVRLEI